MKLFNEQSNIGKSKYVVNYHDGIQKNRDGSMFFGIAIFKNKKEKEAFTKKLLSEGYIYGDSFWDNKRKIEKENKFFTTKNEDGKFFNLALVCKGDNYGFNNCLTHEKDEPMVEFWDGEVTHSSMGQFVSRYDASSLLGTDGFHDGPHRGKLSLQGDVPEWTVDAKAMSEVIGWLSSHKETKAYANTDNKNLFSQKIAELAAGVPVQHEDLK